MISAGLDGNVFAYGVTPVEEIELRPPVEIVLDNLQVGDEVRGTYSLEEAKQKSEYDRRVKEANLLKIKKRKQIESLIERFDKLKNKNAELPEIQEAAGVITWKRPSRCHLEPNRISNNDHTSN